MTLAHQIPEFIAEKIMIMKLTLNPHPTAKLIKEYARYLIWSQVWEEDNNLTQKTTDDYFNGLISDEELCDKHNVLSWDALREDEIAIQPHHEESICWFNVYKYSKDLKEKNPNPPKNKNYFLIIS